MLNSITSDEIRKVYLQSKSLGLIDEVDTAVSFYSLDMLQNRLQHLQSVFPENTHHAIAIKTNSAKFVLREISKLGFGLEAASLEELQMAIECGLSTEKAVFDSPAKTLKEIGWCEEYCPGMILNANSIMELERYRPQSGVRVGLRINPEVQIDAPQIYNVSSSRSKFGVSVFEKTEILEAAMKEPFFTGLHVHAGSEVADFTENIIAIERILRLADDINECREKEGMKCRIEFIDIGGGIGAFLDDRGQNLGLRPFATTLQERCPRLFSEFEVITEFGRFVHTDNAFFVSNIEYILPGGTDHPETAIIHVGADMFLRQAYSAVKTDYPISVLHHNGTLNEQQTKNGLVEYDIAGPLCFSGDYLFRDRKLPSLSSGDKLAIANVGANTTALWSRHCSRKIPKTIMYSLSRNKYEIAHPRTAVDLI